MAIVINDFTISAGPLHPIDGNIIYNWNITNATTITVDSSYQSHHYETVVSTGSNSEPINTYDPCVLTTAYFTLTATDGVDTEYAYANVGVLGAVVTGVFNVTPATLLTISPGQAASLDWELHYLCLATLSSDFSGVIRVINSDETASAILYYPTVTQTYTMEWSGGGGSGSDTEQFWVDAVFISLSASPEYLPQVGDLCTLAWGTKNFATLSIDHGVGFVNSVGYTAISPTISTTYILLGTTSYGYSEYESVLVTVEQLYVDIFDGENTGSYVVDEFHETDGYLKIDGQFKTTTKPDNFEVFTLYRNLNTIS